MEAAPKKFLQELLETPSPVGFEEKIQEKVRSYASSFADEIRTDVHGNVIASCNPDAPLRVMLAGHCDQISLIVHHIDEMGFLWALPMGGWDPQQLIGQRMTVWTESGGIPAVIARKAIHLLDEAERNQVVKQRDLWIDIGATSEADAKSKVKIGDPITLHLGYQEMANGLANSPAMDDKTGVWVVMEALRRAKEKGLNVALHAVSTVQEEIGLRGATTSAYGLDPHVGIAVDVTHATDCPNIDPKYYGSIKLGAGPVIYRGPNMNPIVASKLYDVADGKKIPYQRGAIGRGASNDSNAIQLTRAGVAAGLVAVPNRYMHSAVEMVSLSDCDYAAEVIAEFVSSLAKEEDFTPRV